MFGGDVGPKGMPVVQSPPSTDAGTILKEIPTSLRSSE